MRSIWNGSISFGLVSIPIKMYPATEDHSVSFRQIHTADGGRIRYRKVCELENEPVSSDEIGRAYEDADGALIPVTDEDLAALPLPTTRSMEIEAFIPASEVDPLQVDDAYYLGVNGAAAAKPYALLREALKRSEKVGIAKYVQRGRERLGMLRVVGDTLALHRLLWPDEVREPSGVAPKEKVTVKPVELDLADTLMETLGEVDLDDLRDEYQEALEVLVAAKVSGAAPAAEPGEEPRGAQVVDLMAALRDSVRSARQARGEAPGEEAEEATVHELRGRKKAPAKKSAAQKAPAKKTAAAKKTGPAKKTAAAKETAGKTTAKKTGTEKATAKKTAAKKSTAKKTTAKETTAKKRAGQRASRTAS